MLIYVTFIISVSPDLPGRVHQVGSLSIARRPVSRQKELLPEVVEVGPLGVHLFGVRDILNLSHLWDFFCLECPAVEWHPCSQIGSRSR